MSMRLSGVSPEVQEHVATVIESAANTLLERGWIRGSFGECADGPVCPATAILIAGGHIAQASDLLERQFDDEFWQRTENDLGIVAFAQYLRQAGEITVEDNIGAIWNWNDAEGRTMDEVLTALMACAESLRAGIRAAA